MIFTLIRRNIAGKPFRFLLTCSAVTAGVMFTVGVFVFTDGLRQTFNELAGDIEANVDLAVRTEVEFGEAFTRPPVDVGVADVLAGVPGIAAVQPRIVNFGVVPVDADGDPQDGGTGPNIGFNWESETPNPRLFLEQGRAPEAAGEFVIDADSFADANFTIGDTYAVETFVGQREFELVGTFFFASEDGNAVAGAKLVAFETATALDVINQGAGYNDITVVVDESADREAVTADIEAAIPNGLEVVAGEQLQEEQAEGFDEFIGIFQTVLLVFAFIILVVSAFVIFNVFTILIGQRIRELGLLRAIGATGRQVTTALLGEAAMVGLFATIVGTTLGIGFGWTLRRLLAEFDFGPSGNELLVQPSTFIAGAVVGILVTMASAIAPALRARHISPMAALREDARLTKRNPTINLTLGLTVTVASWLIILFAVLSKDWQTIIPVGLLGAFGNAYGIRRINTTAGTYATLGLGLALLVLTLLLDLGTGVVLALLAVTAVTIFLGVNSISPALARPASNWIGRWPLAFLLGIAGVATTLVGIAAVIGSIVLVALSIRAVFTDFDFTGVLAFVASFIPLALALGILAVGRRAIDAAFIMGWPWRKVLIGFVIFVIGAIGLVTALVGAAGILTAEWSQTTFLPIGAVLLAIAWWAKRWVPGAMKSNARMARENAGRSPRRTASAAAALMIGLALVSTATVVAESFKATFADVLDESVTSDWFISPKNQQSPVSGFSAALAGELDELPQIDTVVSFRFGFEAFETVFDGNVRDSSATELLTSLDHIDPNFAELDESLIDREAIWIHQDFADENGFELGSEFPIRFNDDVTETVRVAGIYTDASIYGNRVISLEIWTDHFATSLDQFVSVTNAEGVSEDEARAAIESVTDNYTQVNVDTRAEFQDRQESQIDQVLTVFNVLLLVAIVIALLGIAITLALSVFERTRELGLVRAVGMTSQQMLRMVLFEGAIIAVFGGVLGVAMGTVFGAAAVEVIPDAFIRSLSIPVGSLLQYLVIAAVAGIGAAIIPARRAARLNVLDAISQA